MGNSILITGGTGYFGQHFVKSLLERKAHEYDRICIYSRSESRQAIMRQKYNDERLRYFIGDVRDSARLIKATKGIDEVVHAAALKRIEVGEYEPSEMTKTNVIGTENVVEACLANRCKAVLLSTDKACEPISPYGWSKALAEKIFLSSGPQFGVVRYGNVIGSTGSVIPTWKRQLRENNSITITDPDCTRFVMYPNEAVYLVMETLNDISFDHPLPTKIATGLPAIRLGDLVKAMSTTKLLNVIHGKEKEQGFTTIVTGLPPHEKKHESLMPGISSDKARLLTEEEIMKMLAWLDENE